MAVVLLTWETESKKLDGTPWWYDLVLGGQGSMAIKMIKHLPAGGILSVCCSEYPHEYLTLGLGQAVTLNILGGHQRSHCSFEYL